MFEIGKLELTPETREELPGSFVELSDGITHYELSGPEDGETVEIEVTLAEHPEEEGVAYLGRVRKATRHMAGLIDDIPTVAEVVAHLEAGDLSLGDEVVLRLDDADPSQRTVTFSVADRS